MKKSHFPSKADSTSSGFIFLYLDVLRPYFSVRLTEKENSNLKIHLNHIIINIYFYANQLKNLHLDIIYQCSIMNSYSFRRWKVLQQIACSLAGVQRNTESFIRPRVCFCRCKGHLQLLFQITALLMILTFLFMRTGSNNSTSTWLLPLNLSSRTQPPVEKQNFSQKYMKRRKGK